MPARTYLRAAGLCLIVSARAGALDLTPLDGSRVVEGVRIPLVLFADPTGRVRYQPPGDWRYSGDGAVFTLYPPRASSASMKLCVVPHGPGLPEIGAIPSPALTKWSQRYVASDAQELKMVAEMPSPFMLDGKPSREFIFAYKANGQRYQTSVAVLDWSEREYLTVIVTAGANDFKTVHDNGIASLFSWSLRKMEVAPAVAQNPKPGDAVAGVSTPGIRPQ